MLFSLPPILRGFIAMIISGASFPLCGVMVLRLDLVPIRYMLMHGVILGGAIALASKLPLVPVVIIINILLVLLMLLFTKNSHYGFAGGSAATMVISMAIASIITHVKDVPAKDTLSLLWGSPFALKNFDIYVLLALAILLTLYIILNYKNILSLFFSQEVAKSMGLKVQINYTIMVMLIALVVALAMQLLGAFLIDSLLILPVLVASSFMSLINGKKGIKRLFIFSSMFGFAFSTIGYIIAVAINWPPAGTIAIISGLTYLATIMLSKIQKK
ncbi:MAG: metal ABC transporter permease [Treponema sp.]|nr:metal ABC transporter permease [Treponema sp.]